MTTDQLKQVIIYLLGGYNTNNVTIDDNTKLNCILDDSGGIGGINSKEIFQGDLSAAIVHSGAVMKTWPANWMTLSVMELTNQII